MNELAGSIVTYTGRRFWPLNLDPKQINALDICHALSQQCRFTGHTRNFYSVAEHSCRVHDTLEPKYKLCGLLHDATEAFLIDLPTPLKETQDLEVFKEVESILWTAICEKFELDPDPNMEREIKKADKILFLTEIRDLMPIKGGIIEQYSANGYKPLEARIVSWTPAQAKFAMIDRLEKLGIKVEQ